MANRDDDNAALKALARLIAYARGEAVRLRAVDVALLLGHAEEVIAVFAPATVVEIHAGDLVFEGPRLKH